MKILEKTKQLSDWFFNPKVEYKRPIVTVDNGIIQLGGSLPHKIILRHGVAKDLPNFIPSNKELIYLDDTKEYRIGDGRTPGGTFLFSEKEDNRS